MLVLGELTLRLGTDAKCRRIRRYTLRKNPFQLLELAKELVVFRVRQRRTIEDIVLVRCPGEQDAQLGGAAKLRLLGRLTKL